MKISSALVKAIDDLIEKNNDAYHGFLKAKEKAKSMDLRTYLRSQADKRKDFAAKIAAEQKEMDPDEQSFEEGSVKGKIHRGWISFRSNFEDDKAILEECIRGDKACIKEYKNVWKEHRDMPPNLTAVLSKQVAEIEQTQNTIKTLEDL